MLCTEEMRISSGHLGLWLVCAFFNGEGKTLIVYWIKIANTLDFSLSLGSSLFRSFFFPLSFFCWLFICLQVKLISKEVQLVSGTRQQWFIAWLLSILKSLVIHNWMFTWKTKLMENCTMHPFSSFNDRTDCLTYYHYYCCGTSEASEQQHNQDLREKYIGYEKSRFDRFLPEFTAPRTHLEPEFTAPRTIASLSFKPRFHFILRK